MIARILIGCEFSGQVRRAFRHRGFDAWSCDLLPADDGSPYHYRCDVRELLGLGWDALIGHPPCPFLTNSANKHLYVGKRRWCEDGTENPIDAERWRGLQEAAAFFLDLWNAPIRCVALENPIMGPYAKAAIGIRQSQVIQPWMFGHPEKKGTCLWLRNLPRLVETNNVREQMLGRPKSETDRVHYATPGLNRWKVRSETLPGIAAAFADQWGPVIARLKVAA